jgi:hypothetical protein
MNGRQSVTAKARAVPGSSWRRGANSVDRRGLRFEAAPIYRLTCRMSAMRVIRPWGLLLSPVQWPEAYAAPRESRWRTLLGWRWKHDCAFSSAGRRYLMAHSAVQAGMRRERLRIVLWLDGELKARYQGRYLEISECGIRAVEVRRR